MTALWVLLTIIGICFLPMFLGMIFNRLGFKKRRIDNETVERSKVDSNAQMNARSAIAAEQMKNNSYHGGGGPFS
ncbi:hypothetical protein GCM10010954_11270 [Halobacillus andaensis]|uniref:Uncharacterized protein n=1 Tax=Halobacillus andaensis TaxID=1176239 RepID=A0A917B1P6_HALAA|nr:hypothetical protein [Halobacillus andaensis]MBP2003922.1 hypothetical protein [Halobacillus andaensis]GGF14378.1 hypothetical protein GCM10010954_11270 [Halobacillus andaensis]